MLDGDSTLIKLLIQTFEKKYTIKTMETRLLITNQI